MNKRSNNFSIINRVTRRVLLPACMALLATGAFGQETGGELGGGAGIFRPKNPEAKRSSSPARPPRPRMSPAEIEARFQDALADGNDARDDRKFVAAEAAYRRALGLKPRDARAQYAIGNVFVDQQRWDDAETAYRAAYGVAPNDPDILIALSFALVQPRTGAANAKRFADAEYFAKRATQLAPTNAIAFDRLGVAMTARGIYNSDAEAAFRRATELNPNLVVAKVHLAGMLRRLNHGDEADALYRSASEQATDAPTLVLIADAMQSQQRWPDSEPILRRALQIDPRNPGALFLMGRFYSVNQRYAEAASALKTAAEVNPKSFIVRTVLARAYLGAGAYDDAFRAYEQAAVLASDADRKALAGQFGFTGVGDGYMSAGRPRDALRAYQRGLQLDPTNADLPTKIAAARAKG
ncbi:MAG TPA: tetratricopeptide repeat protein [Pyrinomonadaceae bacterium]|jgi:tetratricopeptide (TPR) repeat protein|nr:tetratricopeptide repeat protein [Pyrinomonadaceae bacterium]